MYFKRNNELIEAVSAKLHQMDEETKNIVEKLVADYESATYKEWSDRTEFNAEFVERMVNDYDFGEEEVAERMAHTHPTLQQSFMRLCMRFVKLMSEKTYCDARNESSVEAAKKIVESLDKFYFPMI